MLIWPPPPVTPCWPTLTVGSTVTVKLLLWPIVNVIPGFATTPLKALDPAIMLPTAFATGSERSPVFGLRMTSVPPRQMSISTNNRLSPKPAFTVVCVSGEGGLGESVRVTWYFAPSLQLTSLSFGLLAVGAVAVHLRAANCRRSTEPDCGASDVLSPLITALAA